MKTFEVDGITYRFQKTKEWNNLRVVEGNLGEGITGLTLPWKNPGEYRILINSDLSEKEKVEVFIREMLHLYRDDHELKEESAQKIAAAYQQITEEILGDK